MPRRTANSDADAPVEESVATPNANAELEHTAGDRHTRDAMDAGVPMTQGSPDEPAGPEDALAPGPKRGDYSGRIDSGPHMATREVPDAERAERAKARGVDVSDVERFELVPAGA